MTFPLMGKVSNDKLLRKIAARIRLLRDKDSITQEVFYHDTGINIGRIERAKRNISVTTLESICKYLNISISDFFKGIEKE
jgi:transcriptional regulator with XRE-family HTH domain